MFLAVLLGFLLTFIVPLLFKISKKYAGMIISLLPLGLFIYYLSFIPSVASNQISREYFEWIPSLGVNLSFVLDGLSLTFALIISGIGFAVFLYASSYLRDSEKIVPFYIYILIFMASMLGVVTCDNMIAMFVFWELTSISSFLLIGFNHEQEKSRYAALQALLITAGGGLALMASFILMWQVSPTFDISQLFASKDAIQQSPYYTAIFILFVIGAFTKSAQFPFHFWLPNAMEAPTPVSAYLHSATMVKAGIFILAKFSPILSGTDLWQWTLAGFGGWTMLMASVMALKQTDLKKILAYSTVSVLGTLTMLLGIGGKDAIPAMIIYLVAHALYKGALFLTAGMIDHGTGTRDINQLGGLKKHMPIATFVGVVAALSGMGLIPFVGFVGKEMVYESVINFGNYSIIFIVIAVVSAINIFAAMAYAGILPFFGKEKHPGAKPHDAGWQMWLGPILLSIFGLIFGIFSSALVEPLARNAAMQINIDPLEFHLTLWHGFNLALWLSLATIACGLVIYYYRIQIAAFLSKWALPKGFYPAVWYDYGLNGMLKSAEMQTKFLQNGHLRYYIATIILFFVFVAGSSFFNFSDINLIENSFYIAFENSLKVLSLYDLSIGVIITVVSTYVLRSNGRLSSIAALGVSGSMIALLFIINGAPDLAMTQLAIETLTVILFVLVLYKLPRFAVHSKLNARVRDFIIALSAGVLMMLFVLYVSSYPMLSTELRDYFAATSYLIAHGKNVVNVILVDYRGLDTMGEITVLSMAAIGVYSLLRLKNKTEDK